MTTETITARTIRAICVVSVLLAIVALPAVAAGAERGRRAATARGERASGTGAGGGGIPTNVKSVRALPDFGDECAEECIAQWEEDIAACEEERASDFGQIAEIQQRCRADHAGDAQGVVACLVEASTARRAADDDFDRCIALANTTAWNCLRACAQSPSAP